MYCYGDYLADILGIPGYVSARRLVALPDVGGAEPDQRYLAVCDIDAVLNALRAALPTMAISAALDRTGSYAALYR